MIQWALDATEGIFCRRVVVTRHPAIAELCRRQGIQVVFHELPYRNDTVRLGLQAILGEIDSFMFCPGDQPLLRRETVAAEVDFFLAHPDKLVGLAHNGVRGNPCIFPAAYFPELKALREDRGGSSVIRRHEEDLLLFEAPAQELEDADTRCALRTMAEKRKMI